MSYSSLKRRVSIIMGIYNCAETLPEAIDSLLSQTFVDWELIMCDDASTDETKNIAKSYERKYENILVLENDRNRGLAYSLNHCLEYAKSEYIARMDGDDISLNDRLEKEVLFLETHQEYAFVSCSMVCFDKEGDWGVQINKTIPTKEDFAYKSPFCHAPCLMRREVLNKIGNYTVRDYLRRGQDYYLWYKFYKAGFKGYNLQEPLYKMRDDKNAAKRRTFRDAIDGCRRRLEVARGLGLPWHKRIYAFRGFLVTIIPKGLYMKMHKKHVLAMAKKLNQWDD